MGCFVSGCRVLGCSLRCLLLIVALLHMYTGSICPVLVFVRFQVVQDFANTYIVCDTIGTRKDAPLREIK